jgi:hypothetical protein
MLLITFREAFLKKNLNIGLGTKPRKTEFDIDPESRLDNTLVSSLEKTSGISIPFVVSKSIKVAAFKNLFAGTSPCHPRSPNGC